MGVKFSALPVMGDTETEWKDYVAVLDVSDNLVKKRRFAHAVTDGDAVGKGNSNYFGHVKLTDNYKVDSGAASEGIVCSQHGVYGMYQELLSQSEQVVPTWVGHKRDWDNLSTAEKSQYEIVVFDDINFLS